MNATLLVTQAELSPSIFLAHAKVLSHKKVQYPATYIEIKTFARRPGAQQLSIDSTPIETYPRRIFFGMVKDAAFVGSLAANPFKFHHYDIDYFLSYVNGLHYLSEALMELSKLLPEQEFIKMTVVTCLFWTCSCRNVSCWHLI
jgi:hypothetical protein